MARRGDKYNAYTSAVGQHAGIIRVTEYTVSTVQPTDITRRHVHALLRKVVHRLASEVTKIPTYQPTEFLLGSFHI